MCDEISLLRTMDYSFYCHQCGAKGWQQVRELHKGESYYVNQVNQNFQLKEARRHKVVQEKVKKTNRPETNNQASGRQGSPDPPPPNRKNSIYFPHFSYYNNIHIIPHS